MEGGGGGGEAEAARACATSLPTPVQARLRSHAFPLEWITSKISLSGRAHEAPRFEQAAKEAFELNDITGDGMLNNRELHGEGARTEGGWRGRGPTIARSLPRASWRRCGRGPCERARRACALATMRACWSWHEHDRWRPRSELALTSPSVAMPPRAQPAPSRCSALAVTLTLFVRTINSKLPVDLKLPTLEETTAMLEEFDADNNSHLDFVDGGASLPARMRLRECAGAHLPDGHDDRQSGRPPARASVRSDGRACGRVRVIATMQADV